MEKYELKKGNILKDGHTIFLQGVVKDLNRKSYLESQLKEKDKQLSDTKEENERLKKIINEHPADLHKNYENGIEDADDKLKQIIDKIRSAVNDDCVEFCQLDAIKQLLTKD